MEKAEIKPTQPSWSLGLAELGKKKRKIERRRKM